MTSRASQWHLKRGRLILRKARDLSVVKAPLSTKLSLVFIPAVHLLICFLCQYLNLLEIVLLSYTVGAFCMMYIFSNAHEIFHGMISPKLQGQRFKNFFLGYSTLLDLSIGLYFYYKFGHGPHHVSQGKHSLQEIDEKLLLEEIDFDAITNFRNIYKFRKHPVAEPSYRYPSIERNRALRLIVLFVMPLVETIKEILLEPIKLLRWWRTKRSPKARAILRDLLYQGLLMLAVRCALAWYLQDLKFLLYLFLARVFFQGFLHPYGLMWIAIHRCKEEGTSYQPATSMTGRLETFLCAGINLHVEHHDLPWISRRSLAKVSQRLPEFYNDLEQFEGFKSVAGFVTQEQYDNRYG